MATFDSEIERGLKKCSYKISRSNISLIRIAQTFTFVGSEERI